MKRKTGFYVGFLTSVVCMMGFYSSAFSAVRILGSSDKTMVGASGTSGDSSGKTTSAVSQTTRGSSLRFSNATQVASGTATQSYSGLSGSSGGATVTDSPSARLSIGKYLNLSHSTKPSSTGTGTVPSGGTVPSSDLDALQSQIDRLQTSVEGLKADKQNVLIVDDDEYIDITGADNNVISIDIAALKSDLQAALGTDKDLLTEIDSDYKLFWCYADETGTACVNDKQLVVDLGSILNEYDLANENVSLSTALAGKQGKLTTTDEGYIAIDDRVGTIDIKFNKLKADLGISDAKQSEIRYEDGKIQWRYLDDYEEDGITKKWNTADIEQLIQSNLNNYVQIATLEDYVLKSELSGLQGTLTASPDGYLQIVDNQIGVKFNELKTALNIPQEREVEIDFSDEGKIKWRYVGADTWHQTEKKVSDFVDLSEYVQRDELAGLQGALVADENGYLQIQNNKIGIKFTELKTALNIPDPQKDIEMEITSGGTLRWRYLTDFEPNSTEKRWTDVSLNINDLIDNKLDVYQKTLSADPNGFLRIDNDVIGIKFTELKTALNIPEAQEKIEMEITSDGVLRWRYLDEYEQDGETKKWTNVSVDISSLIDGKLENYVNNQTLNDTLENYITTNNIETYIESSPIINNVINTKQVKLTEAENGFIALTPVDGEDTETIGIKFVELREALNIPDPARTSEIRVVNGILQWRYLDEYETNAETGERVEKWTDVYDLNTLLDDWVTRTEFNNEITRIDTELGKKQIKLVPAEDGYIELNQQTGEIRVNMSELLSYLSLEGNGRTSELRVFDGRLQWRYLDEYETDDQGNRVQVWHTLDLTAIELPLYVKKQYLWDNYYNKTYIDNLAFTIETNINVTLENLWPDEGLYLLSASGYGDNKTHVWQPIKIVDGDGVVH